MKSGLSELLMNLRVRNKLRLRVSIRGHNGTIHTVLHVLMRDLLGLLGLLRDGGRDSSIGRDGRERLLLGRLLMHGGVLFFVCLFI